MIKLVLLDFDDTLCLTEEICFVMENEVAKDMGHPPMTRAAHQKNWGKLLELAITERIPGIDAKEFMNRLGGYVKRFTENGTLDAIRQENLYTLQALRSKGKRIGILTSRSLPEVTHLMHPSHPLSAHVEQFYHKDNSRHLKPDPRTFEQALVDFAVLPEEAVYVGDAVTDAIAAKGAGLHFIAVLESGLRKRAEFEHEKVDFFAPKFTDIVTYILHKGAR